MSSRTSLFFIVAIAIWVLAACNWTVGDCYPREEWTSGAGAGPGSEPVPVFSSSASGDFGNVPSGERQGAGEQKIECNKTDSPDEEEEERPEDSSESPTNGTCSGPGDTAGDGQTYVFCSDICSSKCPPAGVNGFSPTIFSFVTTIPDDGTGESGGWQKATVRLKVKRWVEIYPEFWECPQMTFRMPLRNRAQGQIPADEAARISADVATRASRKIMRANPTIPRGIYCTMLKDEMDISLRKRVDGSRVTQP
ncbi:hypothetical protein WME90_33095 [Sorangium sp. So ce375]|uniref:hypothetical protein n=1 Tax=Sorangium sp. So ce375 TaxID=3133306 RepID=UPI003F5C0C57